MKQGRAMMKSWIELSSKPLLINTNQIKTSNQAASKKPVLTKSQHSKKRPSRKPASTTPNKPTAGSTSHQCSSNKQPTHLTSKSPTTNLTRIWTNKSGRNSRPWWRTMMTRTRRMRKKLDMYLIVSILLHVLLIVHRSKLISLLIINYLQEREFLAGSSSFLSSV